MSNVVPITPPEPQQQSARHLLEHLLTCIRWELACPGSFNFKRAEQLLADALSQPQP